MKLTEFKLSHLKLKHEGLLVLLIIAFSLLVMAKDRQAFLSYEMLFDTLESATVYGILAIGFFLILLTGGIDLSFPAVAIASSYTSVALSLKYPDLFSSLISIYLMAILIGLLLGLINGLLVAWLKVHSMVITLGTSAMIMGMLLFASGSAAFYSLPHALKVFSRSAHFKMLKSSGVGFTSLHDSIWLWLVIALVLSLLLSLTLWGKKLYGIGGNIKLSQSLGVNTEVLTLAVFSISGMLSGIAGITYFVIYKSADPSAFMGIDLGIIAMVIIGGASIKGGQGKISGIVLGVILINLINNSLVILEIPSQWHEAVVGGLILMIVILTAWRGGKDYAKI